MSACDPGLRTARLGSPPLRRARRHLERVVAGRTEVSPETSEVDLDPEYRSWDAEVAAARAALERHLHRPEPASRRPTRRRERWLALAAAVLAVLSLALVGLWWGERQAGRRLAEEIEHWRRSAREAVVNVPLAIPREDRRRGSDDSQVVVPSGVPSFLVYIQAPELDRDGTTYRLELLDAATGERLHVWTGVRDNDLSEITLLMPRQLLPAGEYHILLFRDGERRALQSLRFGLELE